MPVIVPPGFASVIHSLALVGDPEPMAVTYGVEVGVETVPQTLTESLHDMFGDLLAGAIADDYKLTRTELALSQPDEDEPTLFIANGDRAGGATSEPLPQNTSYLVHKRSSRAGRRGRGRLYLPGIPEGNVAANGLIDSTHLANRQALLDTWIGRFGSGTAGNSPGDMVILHNYPAADPPASDPTPVTTLILDPVVATQRRRLR